VDRSPGDWSGKAGLQRPLRQPNGLMGSPGAVGPGVSSPREITRNRSGKAATKQALRGPRANSYTNSVSSWADVDTDFVLNYLKVDDYKI
jgi:hypothetical protein